MTGDQMMVIKNGIVNEYTPIVFELQYIVEVQGYPQTIIVGYQTYMPEYNSIQKVEDNYIEMKLHKGPDSNMNDELIISDHLNE